MTLLSAPTSIAPAVIDVPGFKPLERERSLPVTASLDKAGSEWAWSGTASQA